MSEQFDTKEKISEAQKNKKIPGGPITELFAHMLNQNLNTADDEKYEKIGLSHLHFDILQNKVGGK